MIAQADTVSEVLTSFAGARRDQLIPILQAIQDRCGYLSRDALIRVARHLELPSSKVYGVATFYNQFRFQPVGKYHCQVCRGTACHVKGSAGVLETMRQQLKIAPGQTTRDGLFSLEVVACIGACGLAPVIAVNGEFHAGQTSDSVRKLVAQLTQEAATRVGAP